MERQGRVSRLAALVVICFCVLANSCPEPDYLDRVGEWPDGPAESLAVAGDYAYVGARSTLVVMDVSDPADPHVVGRVFFPNGYVRGIAVSGDYAYVAAGDAGFRVIDISTPSAPIEVGGMYLISTAVAVSGFSTNDSIGTGLGPSTVARI